jgi:HEAT repeat protein
MRSCIVLILSLVTYPAFAEVEKVSVDSWTVELSGKDPVRAALAADRLGDLKEKAAPAIPALIKALADTRRADNSPGPVHKVVCNNAADALVNIGEPAVPALLIALEKEKDSGVRYRIMRSLGRIGLPAAKAVLQLKAIVGGGASESDRFYAFDALINIHLPGPELVAFASGQLNDKSPDVRGRALQLLARAGKDAIPAVDQLIKSLSDQEDRWQAVAPDAANRIPLRADAAYVLGRIGPAAAAAVPHLSKLMINDEEVAVRTAAAVALIRINPQDATGMAFLNSLLTDEKRDNPSKCAAAQALGGLGPMAKDSLPALTKLLGHKSKYVRLEAIDAIAEIGGKDAIPLLEVALSDEEEHVREWAQETIDNLKRHSPS